MNTKFYYSILFLKSGGHTLARATNRKMVSLNERMSRKCDGMSREKDALSVVASQR